MTKFDELKERFPNLIPVQELRSNVSIAELAIHYGYKPQVEKGKSRPVLENAEYKDTIIIKNPQDASQQVYQRAGDFTDSGTIIDFVRNRLPTVFSLFNRPGEHEFKNITSVLYDYLRIDPAHVSQNQKVTASLSESGPKQAFAKEQFDIRPLEANNYLTSRNIAPQTLQRPEFTGKVVAQIAYLNAQTGHIESFLEAKEHPERKYFTFNNIGFPYYNGVSSDITGMELRNENVKMHAPGSDRYNSIFISNAPPKTLSFYVMESAIDALSHQQLRSINGDERFNAVYFSTGGQLTPPQINAITRYISSFDKEPNWKINLAFDNDVKGHRFDLQFIQGLVSTKFPMSPTPGGISRVSYLLPEGEAYKPIRDALIDRVDGYNKNVQAQFARNDQDVLGKKEMSNQQIIVGVTGSQLSLSVPEACSAMNTLCRDLLELTGLDQRVSIQKAHGKDFNEDLTQRVELTKGFRYTLTNDQGQNEYTGNVATLMARTLNHLKHQLENDGQTNTFTIKESQPFGFQKTQVELKVVEGKTINSMQTPEFNRQLLAEKVERTAPQREQEHRIMNVKNKPKLGQTPPPRPDDDQPKLKR